MTKDFDNPQPRPHSLAPFHDGDLVFVKQLGLVSTISGYLVAAEMGGDIKLLGYNLEHFPGIDFPASSLEFVYSHPLSSLRGVAEKFLKGEKITSAEDEERPIQEFSINETPLYLDTDECDCLKKVMITFSQDNDFTSKREQELFENLFKKVALL